MFDVELLRGHGGFYDLPYAWGSDNISVFRAAEKDGIAHTQVPVFQYRSNSQSISSSSHNREKMKTVISQFEWIKRFIANKKTSAGELDNTLKKQILKQLEFVFQKEVKYYMITDMKSSNLIISVAYWYRLRNIYKYTVRTIIKNTLKSLYYKI